MATLNRVELIGNLGADPEVRFVNSQGAVGQVKVASFRLATQDGFTGKGGQRQERTEWHNIVCWERLADVAEKYLGKGSPIFVSGRLRLREWKDSEGRVLSKAEVVADNIQLLGARPQRTGSITCDPMSIQVSRPGHGAADDLPF